MTKAMIKCSFGGYKCEIEYKSGESDYFMLNLYDVSGPFYSAKNIKINSVDEIRELSRVLTKIADFADAGN